MVGATAGMHNSTDSAMRIGTILIFMLFLRLNGHEETAPASLVRKEAGPLARKSPLGTSKLNRYGQQSVDWDRRGRKPRGIVIR